MSVFEGRAFCTYVFLIFICAWVFSLGNYTPIDDGSDENGGGDAYNPGGSVPAFSDIIGPPGALIVLPSANLSFASRSAMFGKWDSDLEDGNKGAINGYLIPGQFVNNVGTMGCGNPDKDDGNNEIEILHGRNNTLDKLPPNSIVLVQRGVCSFVEKVKRIQDAGGIAGLVGDDRMPGVLLTMYAKGELSK